MLKHVTTILNSYWRCWVPQSKSTGSFSNQLDNKQDTAWKQDNSSAVDIDTRPSARSQVRWVLLNRLWYQKPTQQIHPLFMIVYVTVYIEKVYSHIPDTYTINHNQTTLFLPQMKLAVSFQVMIRFCILRRWRPPMRKRFYWSCRRRIMENQELCGPVWSLWLLGWLHNIWHFNVKLKLYSEGVTYVIQVCVSMTFRTLN